MFPRILGLCLILLSYPLSAHCVYRCKYDKVVHCFFCVSGTEFEHECHASCSSCWGINCPYLVSPEETDPDKMINFIPLPSVIGDDHFGEAFSTIIDSVVRGFNASPREGREEVALSGFVIVADEPVAFSLNAHQASGVQHWVIVIDHYGNLRVSLDPSEEEVEVQYALELANGDERSGTVCFYPRDYPEEAHGDYRIHTR